MGQVSAQEASDCRAKLARDTLELGKIVSLKSGHVSRDVAFMLAVRAACGEPKGFLVAATCFYCPHSVAVALLLCLRDGRDVDVLVESFALPTLDREVRGGFRGWILVQGLGEQDGGYRGQENQARSEKKGRHQVRNRSETPCNADFPSVPAC